MTDETDPGIKKSLGDKLNDGIEEILIFFSRFFHTYVEILVHPIKTGRQDADFFKSDALVRPLPFLAVCSFVSAIIFGFFIPAGPPKPGEGADQQFFDFVRALQEYSFSLTTVVATAAPVTLIVFFCARYTRRRLSDSSADDAKFVSAFSYTYGLLSLNAALLLMLLYAEGVAFTVYSPLISGWLTAGTFKDVYAMFLIGLFLVTAFHIVVTIGSLVAQFREHSVFKRLRVFSWDAMFLPLVTAGIVAVFPHYLAWDVNKLVVTHNMTIEDDAADEKTISIELRFDNNTEKTFLYSMPPELSLWLEEESEETGTLSMRAGFGLHPSMSFQSSAVDGSVLTLEPQSSVFLSLEFRYDELSIVSCGDLEGCVEKHKLRFEEYLDRGLRLRIDLSKAETQHF